MKKDVAAAGSMTAFLLVAASATAGSLCAKGETAVFDCHLGQKVAELCASSDLTPTGGRLYYIYGRPGAIELRLPNANDRASRPFAEGVLGFSGGGADYVRIKNGRFAYVVYSGFAPGWAQDGLVVERDGKRISSQICQGSAMGANAWQAVYTAKLPKDNQGFDMPDVTRASYFK